MPLTATSATVAPFTITCRSYAGLASTFVPAAADQDKVGRRLSIVVPLAGVRPAGADTLRVEPSAAAVVPVEVEGEVGVVDELLLQAARPNAVAHRLNV